jgi:uncharacterized metal-binding protein YceD (DUF177 family)
MPDKDKSLWSHFVRFDEAFRGLDQSLMADAERLMVIKDAFGMSELHALSAKLHTQGDRGPDGDIVLVQVSLKGEVTQECGVSLDLFRHEIASELEVRCALKDRYKQKVPVAGELELGFHDLDEPDLVEDGQIDLGLYIIEALGEAYDPFARKPGVIFVEPETAPEPSPFAVLAALKRD